VSAFNRVERKARQRDPLAPVGIDPEQLADRGDAPQPLQQLDAQLVGRTADERGTRHDPAQRLLDAGDEVGNPRGGDRRLFTLQCLDRTQRDDVGEVRGDESAQREQQAHQR
jgi:hypothetical protein